MTTIIKDENGFMRDEMLVLNFEQRKSVELDMKGLCELAELNRVEGRLKRILHSLEQTKLL